MSVRGPVLTLTDSAGRAEFDGTGGRVDGLTGGMDIKSVLECSSYFVGI